MKPRIRKLSVGLAAVLAATMLVAGPVPAANAAPASIDVYPLQ